MPIFSEQPSLVVVICLVLREVWVDQERDCPAGIVYLGAVDVSPFLLHLKYLPRYVISRAFGGHHQAWERLLHLTL